MSRPRGAWSHVIHRSARHPDVPFTADQHRSGSGARFSTRWSLCLQESMPCLAQLSQMPYPSCPALVVSAPTAVPLDTDLGRLPKPSNPPCAPAGSACRKSTALRPQSSADRRIEGSRASSEGRFAALGQGLARSASPRLARNPRSGGGSAMDSSSCVPNWLSQVTSMHKARMRRARRSSATALGRSTS
jgi:hypothetical protein